MNIDVDSELAKKIQKRGNVVARKFGCGKADKILLGDEDKLVHHTPFGFRKKSTGEYVSNSYRNKFGWKNTYYQKAHTTVMISINL